MCHRCLDTGRIEYGSDTEGGRLSVFCGCYRGRSSHPPDSGLVGDMEGRIPEEKSGVSADADRG